MKRIQSTDNMYPFRFFEIKPNPTHFKIGEEILQYFSCVCAKFCVDGRSTYREISVSKFIRGSPVTVPSPVGEPLRGHDGPVRSVAFSPNGMRIVSGSKDRTIRVWDAETGSPVGEPLRGHDHCVRSVGFSYDGTRIVSGSQDVTIRIWDA